MSPTIFDAIDYIHKLKEAGVPEQQAETHVKILSEIIESNLATKQDIERIRSEMATKIESERIRSEMATKLELERIRSEMATKLELERIRSEMATKLELEKVKVEIIKWNIGAVLTAAGLFIAIFKLLG